MRKSVIALATALSMAFGLSGAELTTVEIPSPMDGSMQKAMFRPATGDKARPLLVALHTWSGDYTQDCKAYAQGAEERNWNFIFPNFRGPNWTRAALGSELMVSDIVAAVEFAKKNAKVDPDRIYLIGGSGGGHATLLLAGRHPEIWAAVSAWCPIGDVALWHKQSKEGKYKGYADHIERACGGNPQTDAAALKEAKQRSPVTHIANASDVVVDIGVGILDDLVLPGHGVLVFNGVAAPKDRFSDEDIAYIVANHAVPASYGESFVDPSYGPNNIVYARKTSGKARVTLFKGGHNILIGPGLRFLELQKKGAPPVWTAKAGDGKNTELGK